jgi:hypothetical protein
MPVLSRIVQGFVATSAALIAISACGGSSSGADTPAEECPLPQAIPGGAGCPVETVIARDPNSSLCCEYNGPCDAPPGWKTFGDRKSCDDA